MFIDTSAVVSILMGEPDAGRLADAIARQTAAHLALGPP
jgi:uncharacterized protein with PIN domain